MSVEENKATIHRCAETWGRRGMRSLSDFWSPGLMRHTRNNSYGYEQTKMIAGAFKSFFPDMQFDLDDIIAEEDKAVTRMTWSATHPDSFMGVPPIGNRITRTVVGVARLANGRIVEHRGVTDELAMWAQRGLLPEEFLAAMG